MTMPRGPKGEHRSETLPASKASDDDGAPVERGIGFSRSSRLKRTSSFTTPAEVRAGFENLNSRLSGFSA